MHHYGAADLRWDGNQLRLPSGRALATVEPDADWPGSLARAASWRRAQRCGQRTRADDAAASLAVAGLNRDLQQAA